VWEALLNVAVHALERAFVIVLTMHRLLKYGWIDRQRQNFAAWQLPGAARLGMA
jgi:hypothetical protein